MSDTRTLGQRWADAVCGFSGSWTFIIWFTAITLLWIAFNIVHPSFDPYPFLFLNWFLTVISTLQNPLIMLSQNRQNDSDRGNMQAVLQRIDELQKSVDVLTKRSR